MGALVKNNLITMNFSDTQHPCFQHSFSVSIAYAQINPWKLKVAVKLKPLKHCTPDLYYVFFVIIFEGGGGGLWWISGLVVTMFA